MRFSPSPAIARSRRLSGRVSHTPNASASSAASTMAPSTCAAHRGAAGLQLGLQRGVALLAVAPHGVGDLVVEAVERAKAHVERVLALLDPRLGAVQLLLDRRQLREPLLGQRERQVVVAHLA